MRKKIRFGLIGAMAFLAVGFSGLSLGQETDIRKAKIFLETYPLLTHTDLYCSFFILDGPLPKLRIIGTEREESIQHTNGEIVYLSGGKDQGLGPDQVLLILESGGQVDHPLKGQSYKPLFFRRGRVKIVFADKNRSAARIEEACGPVEVGSYLVPFEIKKTLEGKDQGFVPYQESQNLLSGTVIYLTDELNQVSYGNWVLIDLGREAGIRIGQQMTIVRPAEKNIPIRNVGNGIVADVQAKTSTLKILATNDVIKAGYGVEVKPEQSLR